MCYSMNCPRILTYRNEQARLDEVQSVVVHNSLIKKTPRSQSPSTSEVLSMVIFDAWFFPLEIYRHFWETRGGAVVEALRYKPEGRGIDSRCCHWNFSLKQSFRPHYGPGVDSASNRNEYQEYFLAVKAAGA
jgi:hypothetical protein